MLNVSGNANNTLDDDHMDNISENEAEFKLNEYDHTINHVYVDNGSDGEQDVIVINNDNDNNEVVEYVVSAINLTFLNNQTGKLYSRFSESHWVEQRTSILTVLLQKGFLTWCRRNSKVLLILIMAITTHRNVFFLFSAKTQAVKRWTIEVQLTMYGMFCYVIVKASSR